MKISLATCSLFFLLLSVLFINATIVNVQQEEYAPIETTEAIKLFNEFKLKYKKQYTSQQEHDKKFNTFYNNLNYINRLNQQTKQHAKENHSAITTYDINKFMDLSITEFSNKYLMSPKPVETINHKPNAPKWRYGNNSNDLPTKFDWREKGAVTNVRDQASCGSCFAFSAVQNIEGQFFLGNNGPLTELSVQQIVECDPLDCGCFGGFPYLVYTYLQKSGGIVPEKSYPYCIPPIGTCFPCNTNTSYCPTPSFCNTTCSIQNSQIIARINGYENVSTNEDDIAHYLMKNGPLSVCLNAIWLQFYRGGISDPWYCPNELDHCVLLVGFGEEKNWLGEVHKYWILKNSWGSDWGEKGYFRMLRNKGVCGINTMVSSAIVSKR
ncbi:hypothetical protein ABK040_011111 [Willaertia magna]